jgi:hypothetical protein
MSSLNKVFAPRTRLKTYCAESRHRRFYPKTEVELL